MVTVNSEIFARFLFHETSQMRSFVKMKSSQIGEITLLFTDIGTSHPCREFSASKICVLTLFAKNNLAKISEFTVHRESQVSSRSL